MAGARKEAVVHDPRKCGAIFISSRMETKKCLKVKQKGNMPSPIHANILEVKIEKFKKKNQENVFPPLTIIKGKAISGGRFFFASKIGSPT